jgi:hypothetical protein
MNHIIDLHGLSHNQAVAKVENELIGISLSEYWEVEIITGKSKYMQHRIITEILDPMNFFYYIPHTNPGTIVVVQDELLS